jgi:hypothetical protein
MSAGRLSDAHLVIGAAVVTIILGGAAAFIEPPGGVGADGPSSYSAAAGGGKAAFYTLKDLGYNVERSFEPATAIRSDPARTTLLITGTAASSDQDRRALQALVERGAVVLLVGAQGAGFVGVSGAGPRPPFGGAIEKHRVFAPSPLAAGASEITIARGSGSPTFGPSYVAVFAVSEDQPLVATARVGGGRIVWLASPTPLANEHLSSADNLQLLLNVLGPPGERYVLWDEHYHGHSRSLWSYAASTPLPWVGAQAGLLMVAALAAYSRRRGPVRARAFDARISPMEFVDMLLALYRRAGANGAAVAAARARLKRTATSACGLPSDSSDDALARALAARAAVDAGEVADLLGASDRAARDAALPAADALKLAQRLQRLTAAVRSPRRGDGDRD